MATYTLQFKGSEVQAILEKANLDYTRQEIDELIQTIDTLKLRVVETLPATGEAKIIYLVPSPTQKERNIKDEYIWVNDTWELIGNTDIDLSQYYTKTEVDDLLENKQDTLISGTNIKTINNESLLGSGDLEIENEPEIAIGDSTPTGEEVLWFDDVNSVISNIETTTMRVTTIDENSDNSHYPTAKAVYDLIQGIETTLNDIIGGE